MFTRASYKRALLYSAIGSFALLGALAILLPGYRLMIAFFAYTATLNSGIIPFPTMTFAIFLGKTHSPFLVAVVGMLGSVISSVIVYYLGIKLSGNKRIRQIENSGFIKNWKTLACRFPFLSLIVFNTVPLPVEPSRFFAILNRYSVKRYVTAISLGRFVRYFLLAVLGEAFRIPNSVLIALTVMLIVSPFLVRKYKKRSKNHSKAARRDEKCEFSVAR